MSELGPRMPDPRMIPVWQAPQHAAPEVEQHGSADDEAAAADVLVRPFLMTGGRTRPLHDGLRIETLVSATPGALFAPLRFELRQIVELAQQPLSIAEISVRLGIPFGVARVLVADLASNGVITCTEPAELTIEMIERIRDRVRAL
ncbi:MAG: DUF742 domain-containing protein [Micromonosporaceae bacterium]|nr:DUF742 domain-containing protein [Micromonosporaceae bacterium]